MTAARAKLSTLFERQILSGMSRAEPPNIKDDGRSVREDLGQIRSDAFLNDFFDRETLDDD